MNSKTSYLKSISAVCILFFLGCQTEEVATETVTVLTSHSRRIKFDEFFSKTNAMEKFKSIANRPKPGANNRLVYNEAYDFSVETNEIVMIENGDYESYTFAVYRDYETPYVENLVLSKTEDGSYSASLIKYNFTQEAREDIENHEMHEMKAQVKTLSLDNERFNPSGLFSARTTQTCVTWSWPACDFQYRHFAGPKCGMLNGTIDIKVCYKTEEDYMNNTWVSPGPSSPNDNGGGGSPNPIVTEPVLLDMRGFGRELNTIQKVWWNDTNNAAEVRSIAMYLYRNTINGVVDAEAKELAKKMIDLSIEKDLTFEIDDSLTAENSLVFDTVEDFEDFLNDAPVEGTEYQYLEDLQDSSQKTASVKFWTGLPFHGVKVNVKQKMQPTYSVDDVTSELVGFTLFAEWKQSHFDFSISGNIVIVNVFGVSSVKVFFEGVGTVYHTDLHYQIKINKTTGRIISSSVIED